MPDHLRFAFWLRKTPTAWFCSKIRNLHSLGQSKPWRLLWKVLWKKFQRDQLMFQGYRQHRPRRTLSSMTKTSYYFRIVAMRWPSEHLMFSHKIDFLWKQVLTEMSSESQKGKECATSHRRFSFRHWKCFGSIPYSLLTTALYLRGNSYHGKLTGISETVEDPLRRIWKDLCWRW